MEESMKDHETVGKSIEVKDMNLNHTGWYPYFKEALGVKDVNPQNYSPLALAYIGDSIFDVIIRTIEVSRVNMQANKYHKHVSRIVCAPAQARMILAMEDKLTEEERNVFKRGRNAKSYTKAKNASMIDYRNATGYEALLGYLYLKEDFKRLTDVVKMGLEVLEQEDNEKAAAKQG